VMVRKRQVKRRKDGKAWLFSPRIARDSTSNRLLSDVVDRVFDGSAAAVLLNLIDHKDIDDDELRELRRLLNAKLKEKK